MGKKLFPAYDANGVEHRYETMLDARQACELAGYTLTPPGMSASVGSTPRQDYENMNLDTLRKQCLVRQIPNYMRMNRDEWIEALKARDIEDAARLKGAPAPVAAPAQTAPAAEEPVAESKPAGKPKNKPAA